MKFTLSWLKTHLETNATIDELSKKLTALGLEVESVTDHSAALRPFVVAEILQADPHPQADRLRVCRVFDGTTERQVVCGAPNARAGIKVILATEGVVIPNGGMKIKKSAIRGVESNGMLCSARELELGEDSDGIVELPESFPLGASLVDAMQLDDPLFDIAITPNRGDALGVRGIARDLAASGLGSLKMLAHSAVTEKVPTTHPVSVENSLACPLFMTLSMQGVRNPESPEWLKRRLVSIGLKPISALVDITNFITFDLGRPLHVYDLAKLHGTLQVRSARANEPFHALNDKHYALEAGMLVIADETNVQALGGIIGGMAAAVAPETNSITIEGALFDALHVAETGRKLQIDSDARYRFERGVDPGFVRTGVEIAVQMIQEICGGTVTGMDIRGEIPAWERRLTLRFKQVETLGGMRMMPQDALAILTKLGFRSEQFSDDKAELIPPSWRPDIEGEADIVEEILRVHGFDAIPSIGLPKMNGISKPVLSVIQRRLQRARRLLATHGMLETISYAFISDTQAEWFGSRRESMRLLNPISTELSTMRPSLLPGLLSATARNAARGRFNLALFEIGRQFDDIMPASQRRVVAGVRSGQTEERTLYKTERAVDAMDAKADIFALFSNLGFDPAKLQIDAEAAEWYHPGRSGSVTLGGKILLGYFGEIHPQLLAKMDIAGPVAAFECFIEMLPEPRSKATARPALMKSDYQIVERDFAFILDETLPAAQLLKAIQKAGGDLIGKIQIFDIYSGSHIAEGKKSLALTLRLEPKTATLTEDKIETVSKKIIDAAESLGATLRA